jgi:hypothetical protein
MYLGLIVWLLRLRGDAVEDEEFICGKERGGRGRKNPPGSTTTPNTTVGFLYDIEGNTQLVLGRSILV